MDDTSLRIQALNMAAARTPVSGDDGEDLLRQADMILNWLKGDRSEVEGAAPVDEGVSAVAGQEPKGE